MDLTLGDGGHSAALLKAVPSSCVVSVDQDQEAIARVRARWAQYENRLRISWTNFANWRRALDEHGVELVDGIVADLGFSSMQIDTAARGLSFQHAGPLDMRMNTDVGETAADFVNTASEEELRECFFTFGEERFARRIAAAICERRDESLFETTQDLARVVESAIPAPARRRSRIHPATRVFQALRIEVNRELEVLQSVVDSLPAALKPGGRLAILSYHSLEDRIVKHGFRAWAKRDDYVVLTKRPELASDDEVAMNPRARSAKLRVLERVREAA